MKTFERLSLMVQFGLMGWHLTRNQLTLHGPQRDVATDVYALWDEKGELFGVAATPGKAAELVGLATL